MWNPGGRASSPRPPATRVIYPDDTATGQGLLNYFLRGMNSGALTEEEALATGLTHDERRSRSFVKILKGRRGT